MPAELREGVLRRYRALAGLGEGVVPGGPGGHARSPTRWPAGLDLPAGPKQQLLESRDEAHRLALLSELLDDVGREVGHARMAAERASTNGKVSTP